MAISIVKYCISKYTYLFKGSTDNFLIFLCFLCALSSLNGLGISAGSKYPFPPPSLIVTLLYLFISLIICMFVLCLLVCLCLNAVSQL